MSQQLYGRNREEPYVPSYGYGQGSNFIPKIPPVVETKQSQKKPVIISYYPSGQPNNPQTVIAQVETVTREVVQNPVPMIDPMKESRVHHGDGQSRRDDEFINKLQDETIKATADLNNASRIIEPQVLSTNLDQLQLSEQPRKYHGNGTMNDGWVEPADPNQPRKVAELMNRVSNWKGVNNGARPISSDGYNKLGYGNGISRDNGINNGWNKMPNVSQGYEHMGYGGDFKRTTPRGEETGYYNGNRAGKIDDVYTRRDAIVDTHTPRASGGYGVSRDNGIDNGWNKMTPNVTRGYEHMGYGGDPKRTTHRSEETGYYNGNRGGKTDDVYTRRDDIIDTHTPRASGGYGVSRDNGIDNGWNKTAPNMTRGYEHMGYGGDPKRTIPRSEQTGYYNGNGGGKTEDVYTRRDDVIDLHAPRASGGGYNSGMGNQLGYNSGLPRYSYAGKATDSGETSTTTVITSVDAVTKYKGTFVPMMRNEEPRKQLVPVKI